MCEILCDIEECEYNTEGTCNNQGSIHIQKIVANKKYEDQGGVTHKGVCDYKRSEDVYKEWKKTGASSKDEECPRCGFSLEED